MDLVIGNKVILTPMDIILRTIQRELTNGKLRDIGQQRGQNIPVTCPHHKGGFESHPSCQVFADIDDKYTQYGQVYCFTCKYTRTLPEFINDCFDEEGTFGEEWLLQRCDTGFISEVQYLPEIVLDAPKDTEEFLDENELVKYQYYHKYMWKRKLTPEIVDRFEVGFDPVGDRLIFPVRDDKGRLLCITSRNVKNKFFTLPEGKKKPVYLLYYIKQQNMKSVAICESQINALYLWSIGIPAVALFGTGSSYQYELLKKSGVRSFNLYFDGDTAGYAGSRKFKQAMPDDVLITTYRLPDGKDVNDLSPEEIFNLPSE